MSEEKTTHVRIGPSFFGLLTLLFIGLKLAGYIAWPWWAVLFPVWIWLGMFVIIAGLIAAILAIAAWLDAR